MANNMEGTVKKDIERGILLFFKTRPQPGEV